MSRRKKHQEESFETADGFQIEDMEGNAVVDDPLLDEELLDEALPDEAAKNDVLLEEEYNPFWDDDEEDDDEKEEDEYFNSVAENSNWEEGYDY